METSVGKHKNDRAGQASDFLVVAVPPDVYHHFGLFDFENMGSAKYAVVDQANSDLSAQFLEGFSQIDVLDRQDFAGTVDEARQSLKDGDVDFVLVIPPGFTQSMEAGAGQPSALPEPVQVYYDEANILANQVGVSIVSTFVDKMNMQVAQTPQIFSYTAESVQAKNVRYIDLIMPGILGMAIMTSAVIGISTGISRYREQKLLKRLSATPLKVRTFLMAEVASYLVVNIAQVSLIILLARIAFQVQVQGSYLLIYGLAIFGSIIFLNLGFAVAGYSKNTKTAEAMSQVVTMPMMFFSGVFFSTDALPGIVARIVAYLPLTPMIEALRKVSIDAESVSAIGSQLGLMAAWVVVSFLIAWRMFKFKD